MSTLPLQFLLLMGAGLDIEGMVRRRQRLGGTINFYERSAATSSHGAHAIPPQIAAQALQPKAASLRRSQQQLGPVLVPTSSEKSVGQQKPSTISPAHPGGFEPPTFGLEARPVHEQLQTVNGNLGPVRDHFQSLGVALLDDVVAGRAVRRRDAVALARMVLESAAVRAAESLLEADDAELLPRLTALLEEVLGPATAHTSLDKVPSS